ncbi:MAG: 16S rRNA (cytosine(967)-C(5))-methyltransferase RsmB [Burkholderiaceae bacterium]
MAFAAQALDWVRQGHPLPDDLASLARGKQEALPPRSRAAVRDMTYRALRQMGLCQTLLTQLNRQPPHGSVLALQLVALEQLINPVRDEFTIVDQAVQAARAKRSTRGATGLINAVLRRFLRERDALLDRARENLVGRYNFPRWWIERVRSEYPDHWESVLETLNHSAPMTLRVNRRRQSVDQYLLDCASVGVSARRVGPDAVVLEQATDVSKVPGFLDGLVSVQDAGAQLAAHLLDIDDGMRVLDACAAPGGKTAHLLELASLDMVALDKDAVRLQRVDENLRRLGLHAQAGQTRLVAADASQIDDWHDGSGFDRILVDAPCTASGIVRRHPEIRWLRQRRDIETLAVQQQKILAGLWPTLRPGGKLLYATCSVFAAEGEGVVDRFVGTQKTARRLSLSGRVVVGADPEPISQLLPVADHHRDHDGFYYALIERVT